MRAHKGRIVTEAARATARATAIASFLLLLSAALGPTTALSSSWPTSGTPPAPNDPDYQPVETGYPSSCLSQSVDDEQLYFYGFMPKCAPQAMDPENASGMSISTAWQDFGNLAIGAPAVVIAYIEGGINWHHGDAQELADKVYLNRGELPPPLCDRSPCANPGSYDANGDGVFNAADYANDSRVRDFNGNGLIDPEDMITAFTCYDRATGSLGQLTFDTGNQAHCSNGDAVLSLDNDGNGYPHDISGWDFYDHQNDPATYDSAYGHANGQQKQAAAQTDNGLEGAGLCSGCLLLPIKAGAEALDRDDDLAQAWLFAVDSGAGVITSVTANLGYSSFMRQAVEYAWRRGVVMAQSSNDFDSTDHQGGMFWPHVLPGNGLVPNSNGLPAGLANAETSTYRARSDYTSWGTHNMFSVSTQGGTTSESTPTVAGVMGLVLSFGRSISPALTGPEAIQVVRATASRITDPTLPWPGSPGDWNLQYGYGRPNVDLAMRAIEARHIPPVAWIDSPDWYSLYDPTQTGAVTVSGHVEDRRSTSGYHWQLQYGLGPQPDAWITFASGKGRGPKQVSGTLDLSAIPSSFWNDTQNPYRMSVTKTLETTEQYTVSLRLQVTDDANAGQSWGTGEERRSIAVHHDPSLLPGFPLHLGHGGESQAALVDLQGGGHLDLIFGDTDGYVHAIDPLTRLELPGWPVHTDATPVVRSHAGISPGYEPILAPVAVGDLDHTGSLWVVATSTRGKVYVFDAAGHLRAGWPQTLALDVYVPPIPRPPLPFTRMPQLGSVSSPVLYGLSGDGKLQVVQAAWDGYLHIFNPDGSTYRNIQVARPPDSELDSGAHWINDHKLDSTPVIANLDGHPDIVIRSQWTETTSTGDLAAGGAGFLHAYRPDGALLWIAKMPSIVEYYGSAQEFLTEGAEDEAAAPVYPGGTDQVASGPVLSPTYLFNSDGSNAAVYGPLPGSPTGVFLQNAATCIAAPSSCPYSGAQLQNFLAGNLPADAPVFFTTGGVFGRLSIPGNLTYAQPGTGGASLAAALLFSGSGFAVKNYVTDFDAATGANMPGFAQQIQGLDFLGSPIVADVSGDGQPDLVVGSDSSALMAYQAGGAMPGGFPKFTTGWAVWAPSSGDLLSDGHTDIVQLTREGYVFAWRTDGTYAGDQEWWAAHHDEWRSGRYGVDSRPPGAIRNARLSGSKLTFTAPGGDWYDGQAAGYRVSFSSQLVPATAPARSQQSITVPAGVTSFTIQAVDQAGNLGPALTVSKSGGIH